MALVVGLNATGSTKVTVIAALLITALADNLTDSLSIHIYQESERLEPREALIGTLSNFATRLVGGLTFVVAVYALPPSVAVAACLAWGMTLLGLLTALLARERGVSVVSEIAKHVLAASAVLAVSRGIAKLLV
ncbi:MAG TPA: hypothetical protein VMG60_16185 [Burkholderiaceae bacterium]|nr:hypothetical protein [Burkholderiaceae bacterium]